MKKMFYGAIILLTVTVISCKSSSKENKDENSYPTPALDIIKGQVKQIDTSVQPIIKLIPVTDSTYDSVFVDRKDFRTVARDFLELPDVSGELKKKYKEERTFDDNLGQAIFTAVPFSENNLEVRRQELRIVPNPPNDQIKSLYFETFKSGKDSTVMKRMTWYMDKKFQVATIIQKPGQPDKTSVLEVVFGRME